MPAKPSSFAAVDHVLAIDDIYLPSKNASSASANQAPLGVK